MCTTWKHALTLLPHKTRSKLSRSGQANPGFEGGQRQTRKNWKKPGGCRGGVQGWLGGVQGVPGVVQGGSRSFGRKNGNCMASLLRSNIQDFVEVPVGQMAQGTPFRCLPTSQVSNTPPKGRRIYIYIQIYICIYIYTRVYVHLSEYIYIYDIHRPFHRKASGLARGPRPGPGNVLLGYEIPSIIYGWLSKLWSLFGSSV